MHSSPYAPRRRNPAARLVILVGVFVAGAAAGAWLLLPLWKGPQEPSPVLSDSLSAAAPESQQVEMLAGDQARDRIEADLVHNRHNAITAAAETCGPAVVSITVTQVRLVRGPGVSGNDPFERFFSRYFGGEMYYQEVPGGLGSGLIIDPRGIVVTNAHVVENAREIKVTLPDGRTFDAELMSADAGYDLAVLRIPDENLPVAPIGNSDQTLVGEWAIAIGNPFGYMLNDNQPSVTVGVVSATHRDIQGESGNAIYKDMIQTDAAINPGNSGGPLVNSNGEVIGINTFIWSPTGASIGIGFAIPSNTVVRVVREILEYGRVRQVWIGLRVREISGWLQRHYRIADPRGLLVASLDEGSPAARAGIELGDIIRTVNGEPVNTAEQAQHLIFGATVGDRITLGIERQGRRRDAVLDLIERPDR